MTFEVSTTSLVNLIAKTERVTSKKSALPILSKIFFLVSEEGLRIRSTNLEIGVEGVVAITTEGKLDEKTFVISASLLKNFLQQIKSSKTTKISLEGNNAIFETENAKATIATEAAEDYPTLPELSAKAISLNISAKEFIDGVNTVWYASATSTMKPELSSIFIHTHNNELYFVATDTFRLAEKVITSKTFNHDISLLIPSQNALELTRLVNEEKELELKFDDNLLEIIQDGLRITARVVDGNFPDYRQIIPDEFDTTATTLFHDLENSLRLSSIFADKYYQVTITFDSANITLESKGTEEGKSITSIPTSLDGIELSSRFNQKYLIEPLNALRGDNIELKLSDSKPMMMTNPADNSFRYLVMPMHN